MGGSMFDDYNEEEEEFNFEEQLTQKERIQQILLESKTKYEEKESDRFEDTLILKNGILFAFDEIGDLIAIESEK